MAARLKDKVGSVLQETRILVLSSQVLLGFQLRAHFEDGFSDLTASLRWTLSAVLVAMVVGLTLLIAPSQFHRIADRGDDSRRMHRYTSGILIAAMALFLVSLSADLYVVATRLMSGPQALLLALAGAGMAAVPTFAIPWVQRRRRREVIDKDKKMDRSEEPQSVLKTDVKTKISHVLTETRLVLPGAQALLGFQFITFLTKRFEGLPPELRRLHLLSLMLVAASVVLLVAPAAYHRISERGEETNHFYRYASRLMVLATIPLGLGIAGDVYLVLWMVSKSGGLALGLTLALLALMALLWFVVPLAARRRRPKEQRRAQPRGQRVSV